MRYIPALDGLRAIAVVAVVAFHAGAPFAAGGFVGVDVFFVLSGYLITALLATEQETRGGISLKRFYLHRALRLYPTLLLLLLAFLLIAPAVWPALPRWKYAVITALYASDYYRALWDTMPVLSYTWSLSVEEHFYLLLPLCIPWLVRTRSPGQLLLALYLLATLWRVGNLFWLGWDAAYFRFDTRMSGLLLGCALAFTKVPTSPTLGWLALLTLAVTIAMPGFGESVALLALTPLAELATAVLIVHAVHGSSCVRPLASSIVVYIGKLSYGIYLWHFPLVYWIRDRFEWQTSLLATLAAAFTLAAITFHLVDDPVRRWRKRGLREHRRLIAASVPG